MNKKLYLNLIFLMAGSFVVLTMVTIVTVNFFKDSRLLGNNNTTVAVEATPTPKPTQAPKATQTPETTNKQSTTLVYVRAVPTPAPRIDYGESMPSTKPVDMATPTPSPSPVPIKAEKFTIEVVNCTGAKNAAEDVKTLLEAAGFEVSAGNGPSDKPVRTEIIERNDKNAGAAVKNILKLGNITKNPDPNSKYDVTVIIGDDYLP